MVKIAAMGAIGLLQTLICLLALAGIMTLLVRTILIRSVQRRSRVDPP